MSKFLLIILILVLFTPFIFGETPDEPEIVEAEQEIEEPAEQVQVVRIDIGPINNPDTLWGIFLQNPDTETAVDILIKLGNIGRRNRTVIDNLNNYLMGINLLFKSGSSVNYTVVSACISAIMELGDNSSFPALFSVIYAGYPEVIASEAHGALEVIPGNLHQFLLNVIRNNPPDEKFAAFRTGLNTRKLTVSQQGQLAEVALEQGLAVTDEDNIDLTAMRYAAVLSLTSLRWTRANALAIRHYYRVQSDYLQNAVSKERFIQAITCLGAVGNSDAALVLGLQLGLINARTESTGAFDPDITMALVQALGLIGYNAAFDHLLYVSNLSYPEDIQAAAREAVARLKW
ncbi:MAG: hypothetical protein FWD13_04770 [Treponema sp.]|nr:hypothetical protein [Treponema sp.]